MPNILISEKDLTRALSGNVTDNITYIAGYANMGPVNTPVLCESLEDFKATFGTSSYVFTQNQAYPEVLVTDDSGNETLKFSATALGNNTVYAYANEEEKSYIYATELLSYGLPVLFERVMSNENIAAFTATSSVEILDEDDENIKDSNSDNILLTINALEPGRFNKNISYTLINEPDPNNSQDTIQVIRLYLYNTSTNVDNLIYESEISLNPASDYYVEKLKPSLVSFKLPTGTIIPNTAKFKEVEVAQKLALPGTTLDTTQEFTVYDLYKKFYFKELKSGTVIESSIFDKLADRGEYNIKFITSGSYPVFEYGNNIIAKRMLKIAGTRGDSVALIDHVDNINRSYVDKTTGLLTSLQLIGEVVVKSETDVPEDARKYGAMFTPYAYYNKTNGGQVILPGSYAYLLSLAVSVKTNENWYAVAGVTRGLVPNLVSLRQNVTGAIAEELQPEKGISINPITNIKPYGYCIWGNRTMNYNRDGLVASSFLNIRALTDDVKKIVYTAARKLTFELNTEVLWLNFKAEIEPTLDRMVSGNGLSNYKIIRKTTNKRATIAAVIKLYAIEAVENWDITIELSDSYISVE